MKEMTDQEINKLIDKAIAGDKDSLEKLVVGMQDMVFNLSLRMLGTFVDAQDATQDILLKMITHLSTFRKESSFTTWVFRIAVNHLKTYRKNMFSQYPLSFEYYGQDIENGKANDIPDLTQNVEQSILAEELKMSCINVMLQCLDTESRCIFLLGTMFKVDSRIAGDILGMTPEAYRKRLSRIRKKMADFLDRYCGEYGKGACRCKERINYAITNHRLDPKQLEYSESEQIPKKTILDVKQAMEEIDELSQSFSFCKLYRSPEHIKHAIENFLSSTQLSIIQRS